MLKRMDGNSDGKITKEEFMEHNKKEMEERFKRLDSNGDGVVDKTEMEAATKKLQELGGKARERMHQRRGGDGLRKKPDVKA